MAWADWRFQWIHPFKDFNGRISRVLLAALLYRLTLPYVPTAPTSSVTRRQYLNALRSADQGDLAPLTDVWSRRLAEGLRSGIESRLILELGGRRACTIAPGSVELKQEFFTPAEVYARAEDSYTRPMVPDESSDHVCVRRSASGDSLGYRQGRAVDNGNCRNQAGSAAGR